MIRKIYFYLICLLCNLTLLTNVQAQTIDLRFQTNLNCDNNTYQVTIQMRVAELGQTANIGSSSILFDYNASALQYDSYTSHNFDGDDLCLLDMFKVWDVHGIDGSTDGTFNITMNLEGSLNPDQATFSCPTIDNEWLDVGTVNFIIEDSNINSALVFSDNDALISFNNFNPNDGTDQYAEGSFTNFSESLECIAAQPPIAVADASSISGIMPAQIDFDASGSSDPDGTIQSYLWNFGDGATSTDVMPSHTYTEAGTYTVTLTVTDNDGMTDIDNLSITIAEPAQEPPVAEIQLNPAEGGPAPLDVAFGGANSSDGDGNIVSYEWDFGDGNTATGVLVENTFVDPGTYVVELTVTDNDGLTNTTSVEIVVSQVLAAPFALFDVSLGSGVIPFTTTFDGSASMDIDGNIVSYEWNFGDGTTATGAMVTHTFTDVGEYDVTLTVTDNDGLTSTSIQSVSALTPLIAPTAAFIASPLSGTAPLLVNFNAATSTDTDGFIVSYDWDFGDGSTGTGVTPNHTYTESGVYMITLTVTDNDGLTDSFEESINVIIQLEAPTPFFIATENFLEVTFDASGSTDIDGEIVSYDWSFGDGNTATGVTTVHTYASAGMYVAILTVTDNDNLSSTYTYTFFVEAPPSLENPTAFFTASPISGDAPLFVSFNASGSSDSDGTIVSYIWDYGDGSNGTGQMSSHTYTNPGTYTAELIVTDNDGLNDTYSVTITVEEPIVLEAPNAFFTASPTSGDGPLFVSFNANSSSDSDGTIVSYSWDYGDGSNGTGMTSSHTYTTAGTYTAELTVTDNDGLSDTHTVSITVSEPPAPETPNAFFTASPTSGDGPLFVSFNASGSSDSDGTIVSYSWDYGDGSNGTGMTSSHTYTTAGTYTAVLTVTDNDDLTDEYGVTIIVTEPSAAPTAFFTLSPNSAAGDFTVDFDASDSSDDDGVILTYVWNFGDGNLDTGVSTSHTYAAAGTYTVTLTVTDDDGLSDTFTASTTIEEPAILETPTALFTTNVISGTAPLFVAFDASGSTDADGSILDYEWDFGDGATANGSGTSHTYTTAGTYATELTVTDNDGLTDTYTVSIEVIEPTPDPIAPTAIFTANPSTGSAPLLVNFDASASFDEDGSIVSYDWEFGDGNTDSGLTSIHTYADPGIYLVKLTVTDNDDLTHVYSETIFVTVPTTMEAPTASFEATPLSGTVPLLVSVNASGSDDTDGEIVSYEWEFGDGNTASGTTATNTYETEGVYTLKLTITDNDGLTSTASTIIVVDSEEVLGCDTTIQTLTDTSLVKICSGTQANLASLFNPSSTNTTWTSTTGNEVNTLADNLFENDGCETMRVTYFNTITEFDESNCQINITNEIYMLEIYPQIDVDHVLIENCGIQLLTCPNFEVYWIDEENTGNETIYYPSNESGQVTFAVGNLEAPSGCVLVEYVVDYDCTQEPIDCGQTTPLCVESGDYLDLCPDFCNLTDDYVIIAANTNYPCSINLLTSECIRYTPFAGNTEAVTDLEIVACQQQGSNTIFCDTITYQIQIGACSPKPEVECNTIVEEYCTQPNESVNICVNYCTQDKLMVSAQTASNSNLIYIDNYCLEYIPKPGLVDVVDTVRIVACDYNYNCDTVMVLIDVNEDCDNGEGRYITPVDCELIFPSTITPNNDGVNDYWYVQNLDKCVNLEDFQLSIFDRLGQTVYETSDPTDIHDKLWNGEYLGSGERVAEGTYFYQFRSHSDKNLPNRTGYIEVRY